MRTTPCCGYVLKVTDLVRALRTRDAACEALAETLTKEADNNTLLEFLSSLGKDGAERFEAMTGFAFPCDAYLPDEDNGDCPGDLEQGEWYFVYEECDLFVMKPTKIMENMQNAGCDPMLRAWATFG